MLVPIKKTPLHTDVDAADPRLSFATPPRLQHEPGDLCFDLNSIA